MAETTYVVIDLRVLFQGLGVARVEAGTILSVEPVDAHGTKVAVAGRDVTFYGLESVPLGDLGEVEVEVPVTDGTFCLRWQIRSPRGASLERFTLAPPSEDPIPFGWLPQVDRRDFQPTTDIVAAWTAVAQQVTGARNDAVDAATRSDASAGASALSAEAAYGSRVAAAGSATAADQSASNADESALAAAASEDRAFAQAGRAEQEADTAIGAATSANGAAVAAGSSADAAAASAGAAGVSAGTADQRAADAAGSATAAAASELAAAGSATTAGQKATDASASATLAGQKADAASADAATALQARLEASGFQTTASAAAVNAEASRVAAEAARTGAETARTGAEAARTGAETAQGGAQTARTGAEAARDLALAGQFAGTALGTADLNTITTPGAYWQNTPANATAAANYPVAGSNGFLDVRRISTGSGVLQRYTPHNGNASLGARAFYERSQSGSTWTPWRVHTTQRVNQPSGDPGTEVFTWDDVNSAELGLVPIKSLANGAAINGLTAPGVYRQGGSGAAADGYPIDAFVGVIVVVNRTVAGSGGAIQIAYKHNALTNDSRRYWMRTQTGSGWGAWSLYGSISSAVTAGVPGVDLRVWDDSNARMQGLLPIGITLSTTENLNNVTVPGTYSQPTASATATSLNYPANGAAWHLEVFYVGSAATVVQRATAMSGIGANAARGYWTRRLNGGTWDSWAFVGTTRWDQTAGRAAYAWDVINNREQLIYGDTGERTLVTADLINSYEAVNSLTIRRSLFDVSLSGVIRRGSGSVSDHFITLPVGFRTGGNNSPFGFGLSLADRTMRDISISGSNLFLRGAPADGATQWFINARWRTNESWPTALPGTALNTIPNG